MSKLLVRLTIILTALYLIACYLIMAVFQADIWNQFYYLLFELCVCLCISKQGVYHCRFIKWSAYAILIEETVAYTDIVFDWLPIGVVAILQPTILIAGITATTTLAIRHYIKVRRIKKIWR